MFQKNEIIFSSRIGVCRVAELINLSVNKKMPVPYYLLCSVFDKEKIAYIPVNKHQVLLRKLISLGEAKDKVERKDIPLIEQQEIKYVLGKEDVSPYKGDRDGRE